MQKDIKLSTDNLAIYIRQFLEYQFSTRYFLFGKRDLDKDELLLHLELAYGLIFVAIFCILPKFFDYNCSLIKLSFWGIFFLTLSSISAGKLCYSINLITQELIQNLSEKARTRILKDLKTRFHSSKNLAINLTVTILTVLLSDCFLQKDINNLSIFELIWWSIGFFYIYFLCVITTNILTFYIYFSKHLHQEKSQLYRFEPIKSKLIVLVQIIGQRALLFWLFINLYSIPSIIILRNELPSFLIHMVPVGSFFSFLFGTVVYLNSEQYLKKLSNEIIFETQSVLERRIHLSLQRIEINAEDNLDNFAHLIELRRNLKPNNSLLSLLPSILSTIVPFLGPLITILTIGK